MPEQDAIFDFDSARRIGKVVRQVERDTAGVGGSPRNKVSAYHFELIENAGTSSSQWVYCKIYTLDASDELISSAKVYHPKGELNGAGTSCSGVCVPFGEDFYYLHTPTTLHRFELLTDFVAGSATADILNMGGSVYASSQTILDPELVFDELTTGDTGYCFRQTCKYYAIQAPCPA